MCPREFDPTWASSDLVLWALLFVWVGGGFCCSGHVEGLLGGLKVGNVDHDEVLFGNESQQGTTSKTWHASIPT